MDKNMDYIETAKKIMSILGVKGNDPAIINALMDVCANCDKYGPLDGKPCMSLRLALDMGCEYTPPEWCKDKTILN